MEEEGNTDGSRTPDLTPETIQVIEGEARAAGRLPCPACGRPILAGQEVATSLGDVRLGALGVTVHARCFAAVGRAGLLELMVRAYQQRAIDQF